MSYKQNTNKGKATQRMFFGSDKCSISSKSETNYALTASIEKSEDVSGKVFAHRESVGLVDDTEAQEERSYEKLNNIFQSLMVPTRGGAEIAEGVFQKLPQFSSSQLLANSNASLWKKTTQTETLSSYCKTLSCLNEKNMQISLLESQNGSFLVVQKKKNSKMYIIEAEQFALSFFEKRKQLLKELASKCGEQGQQNRMSQLSREIVVLYREYRRLRQDISRSLKSNEQKDSGQEAAERKIKLLRKQLKELKKSKRKNRIGRK